MCMGLDRHDFPFSSQLHAKTIFSTTSLELYFLSKLDSLLSVFSGKRDVLRLLLANAFCCDRVGLLSLERIWLRLDCFAPESDLVGGVALAKTFALASFARRAERRAR